MPDLIMHIGHFKTGTTALQVFLADNRVALAQQGLVYAEPGLRRSKHSDLARALMAQDSDTPRKARRLWGQVLDAACDLPDGHALLLSSEDFMRLADHPAAMAQLRGFLAAAPEVRLRVIAYLRAPGDHLRSWYNQLVKIGVENRGFDAAILHEVEPLHWDYAHALQPWIALAGAEAVILRGFDDRLRGDTALFVDFLSALGVAMPEGATLPPADANPRLDPRLVALRRAFVRAGMPPDAIKLWLERARWDLAREDARHAHGTDAAFAAIRAKAEAGLRALSALPHAGFDLERLLSSLPHPQDKVEREQAAIIALIGAELAQLDARLRAIEARLVPDLEA